MISVLKLTFFFLVFLIIPGYSLARRITANFISRIFVSFGLSIVGLTVISFFEGWFGIRYLSIIYVGLLNILFLVRGYYKDFFNLQIKLSNLDFLNIGLIFIGIIFQGLTLFKTGRLYDFGVGYWGPLARDGVWHEAVIGQLVKTVPPENPGFSGAVLVNYHYFYNLLVAKTHLLTSISVQTLLYRYYPILLSMFLGIGTYILSNSIFKKREVSFFVLFITYFGSSFGWIVEFIRSRTFGGESAFWANQPVSMNINPPFAISLVLIILLVYLFLRVQKNNKFSTIAFVIIGSSLIGFKVYAGVLFLLGLMLLSIHEFFLYKTFKYIKIFITVLLFSLTVFFVQVKLTSGLIEFHPFWFLDSMIDLTDRVGWLKLASARTTYFQEKNWIKYFAAESLSLLIFVVGNLGTRIIAIFFILKIFWKNLLKGNQYSLIIYICMFAFLLPLFFVQKGNPWNTIQFFYYLIYFAGLFAGFVLYKIYSKKSFITYTLAAFIFVITPISSLTTFRSGLYSKPPASVNSYELEALKFLSKQNQGIVFTHPFVNGFRAKFLEPFPLFSYAPNAYVSAYSKHTVYLEDVEQQLILNTNFSERLNSSNMFFETKDLVWSNNFLKEMDIVYIYLPKAYQLPMAEEEYNITKIFENKEVNIYKVR